MDPRRPIVKDFTHTPLQIPYPEFRVHGATASVTRKPLVRGFAAAAAAAVRLTIMMGGMVVRLVRFLRLG